MNEKLQEDRAARSKTDVGKGVKVSKNAREGLEKKGMIERETNPTKKKTSANIASLK